MTIAIEVPTQGEGAPRDLTSIPGPRTFIFRGQTPNDSIFVEVSNDSDAWVRITQLTRAQVFTTNHGFDYARVVRADGTGACTMTVVASPNLKGDKGDTGDKGDKGDTGDTGEPGVEGPRGTFAPPLGVLNLEADTTWSILAKTAVLTLLFEAPSSGSVEIRCNGNISHGNNIAARWSAEIVGISESEKAYTTHGHTSAPLSGLYLATRVTGLTPASNYQARLSITPSGTVQCLAASQPTSQHLTLTTLEA